MLVLTVLAFLNVPTAQAGIQFIGRPNDAKKIVIFVHGLWGGEITSFATPNGKSSWPELMANDGTATTGGVPLSSYAIATVDYPVSFNIPEIVTRLENDIRVNHILQNYTDIFFVDHSEGGIIVKDLLIDANNHDQELFKRTRATFIIATPSRGVWAAYFAEKLKGAGPQPAELTPISQNDLLITVQKDWQRIMRLPREERPAAYCAYEKKPTPIEWRGVTLSEFTVVPLDYIDDNCDDDALAFDADHLTIVKPESVKSDIYRWVSDRLSELDAKSAATRAQLSKPRLPSEEKYATTEEYLPLVLLTPDNKVPACVTTDRLINFILKKNAALPVGYGDIAVQYKTQGEGLNLRWDFAFYQMLVVTNYLKFSGLSANPLAMRPENYNVGALGATDDDTPGEKFSSLAGGVQAHLEHIKLYSGEPVRNPVAERTRWARAAILPWAQSLGRPVTFSDLARRWYDNADAGTKIQGVADEFWQNYCR